MQILRWEQMPTDDFLWRAATAVAQRPPCCIKSNFSKMKIVIEMGKAFAEKLMGLRFPQAVPHTGGRERSDAFDAIWPSAKVMR